MRRATIAVTVCAALSGCAGMNYVLDNYKGVEVQSFKSNTGKTFRIFDKPGENRLMITPSIGDSAGSGFVKGATLGTVNPGASAVVYRDAAEEFLRSTGRSCRAQDTTLIIDPQYEVRYICDGMAARPSPAMVPQARPAG